MMNLHPSLHLQMAPSFDIPGVLSLTASNPYWLGMTMIRLQEFYESRHSEIRGQVFSLETVMDLYAGINGDFTYASDFGGYNVPGEVCDRFYTRFRGTLGTKEAYLFELIQRHRPKDGGKFYLIGTCEANGAGYLRHELAHAAWYLDPVYKKTMKGLLKKLSTDVIKNITDWLARSGYARSVYADEIQAYLSTNTKAETKSSFKINPNCAKPFQAFYRDYFKKRFLDRGRVQI